MRRAGAGPGVPQMTDAPGPVVSYFMAPETTGLSLTRTVALRPRTAAAPT